MVCHLDLIINLINNQYHATLNKNSSFLLVFQIINHWRRLKEIRKFHWLINLLYNQWTNQNANQLNSLINLILIIQERLMKNKKNKLINNNFTLILRMILWKKLPRVYNVEKILIIIGNKAIVLLIFIEIKNIYSILKINLEILYKIK